MTAKLLAFEIPEPREDDDDDVAWALQTAQVQWNREAYADTIVWLRRAEESAKSVGALERAQQIDEMAQRIASDMAEAAAAEAADVEEDVVTSAPRMEVFEDVRATAPAPPPAALDIDIEVDALTEEPAVDLTTTQASTYQSEEVAQARSRSTAPIERVPDVRISGRPPPPPRRRPPPAPSSFPVRNTEPDSLDAEFLRDTSVELEEDAVARGMAAQEERVERARRDSSIDSLLAMAPPDSSAESEPAVVSVSELVETQEPAREMLQHSPSEPPEQDAPTLPRMRAATPPAGVPAASRSEASLDEDTDKFQPYSRPEPLTLESEPPDRDATERKLTVAERARESSLPPPEADAAPPPEDTAAVAPATHADPPAAGPAVVGGVNLAEVHGLEDLPEDAQLQLARGAEMLTLAEGEEISQFEVALVTSGSVQVMPAIDDLVASTAASGDVVFTTGSLEEGMALRVVAAAGGAKLAIWKKGALELATADCPWVADELKEVADRLQSLAGAAMGQLGERLDDALRDEVTRRLKVRRLLPDDVIIESGSPVSGMFIVGAGRLEVVAEAGVQELLPGDFVLPEQILSAGKAPATVRAGAGGALVLFGERMIAHELLVSVPPLIEILSG